MPPPDYLAAYDRIQEGFANRIKVLAEQEADHRRRLESRIQRQTAIEVRIGQFLAFGIGVVALVAGTYAVTRGAEIAGGFKGTGGVVGLVTAFTYGRRGRASEES